MKSILILVIALFTLNLSAAPNVWEGTPLKSFSLQDQSGKNRTDKDFSGKWLILYFYPKDKTPGCTIEAQNFTDDYAQYQKLGVEIVGVSYDDVDSHKDFADTYEIPFTLLADTDAKLSKAMKVDRILPWPHASRQTFIINPDGIIVEHIENVKPKIHSQQLLTKLEQHLSKK
ncbi:MAG: peroxiredoxin [Kangiellaceae bacterium]|nr:peroxiredoxin [Kangiellaceae bacterium]MCW8997176.1 peroxiredoxin [Kangiellaceae bacterium]MCW9015362.1 peroxiredoxin [Kangiellaceae bacterium]